MPSSKKSNVITDMQGFLKKVQPFCSLTQEVIKTLLPKTIRKMFPANNFIFKQGDNSQNLLFIIISGLAEVRVKDEKGNEIIVGYRHDHEFFGETVIFSKRNYPVSIKALTTLDCLLIKQKDLAELIENNSNFASLFTQKVLDRMYDLFHHLSLDFGNNITYEEHIALKRASEFMTSPVITCFPEEKISKVAEIMTKNHISSIVLADVAGKIYGLITENDLVENVIVKNKNPNTICALEVANAEPVCICSDDFYYQVLLTMVRRKTKHAVVAKDNKPLGIVTIRDLIRARNLEVISIVDRIETRTNIEELAFISEEITQILKGLVTENAPLPEIFDIITEFYDRLTRQIINISIEKMIPDYGPPPVKFCWLTMGSSGRREQYLHTDQDNALIYENISDKILAEKAEIYFANLANLVNEGLTACGFSACPGDVMASNFLWRGDERYWHSQISTWIENPKKEHMRDLVIFLDFRPVYGYNTLAEELRKFVNINLSANPVIFSFMAEDACQGKIPLGFLGKPVGEHSREHRNEIDLKRSALVFLVDCIRLFALREKSLATNTLERLKFLKETNALSEEFIELLEVAFQTIMLLRLHSNLNKLLNGKTPDNYLDLTRLSQHNKSLLKNALKTIERLVFITKETFLLY